MSAADSRLDSDGSKRWVDYLSDEDLVFLKRFALSSGSLKELAQAYGITYPTVRLRLDRLITKIKVLDDREITGEFERLLRALHADGRIDMGTLKTLLTAHKKDLDKQRSR